jgi:hypothetical protein
LKSDGGLWPTLFEHASISKAPASRRTAKLLGVVENHTECKARSTLALVRLSVTPIFPMFS